MTGYHRRKRELRPGEDIINSAFRAWKRIKPFAINSALGVIGGLHGMVPLPPTSQPVSTETRGARTYESGAEGTVSSYKEILRTRKHKRFGKDDGVPRYLHRDSSGVAMSIAQDTDFISYSGQSNRSYPAHNMPVYTSIPVSGYRAYYNWALNDYYDLHNCYSTITSDPGTQFRIDYTDVRLRFTNGTTLTNYCTIYDIVNKTDVGRDPSDLSTDWNLKASQMPLGAFQKSIFDYTGNRTGFARPGIQPNEANLFKDNFKILKTTRVFMRPGAVHEHKVFISHHKHMDSDEASKNIGYRGFTHWVMILVEGQPSYDLSNHDYAFAPTEILWTISSKIRYSMIEPVTKVIGFSGDDSVGQVPTNIQAPNPEGGTIPSTMQTT